MPPKKPPPQEKKPLLGRPGNNLKIGIVGAFLLVTFHSPFTPLTSYRAPQRWKIIVLQCPIANR